MLKTPKSAVPDVAAAQMAPAPSAFPTAEPARPSPAGLILQAKLQVGSANDPLEAEADRAAADFMRSSNAGAVARVDDDEVRRAADGAADMMGAFDVSADIEGRIDSARSGGKPLPDRDKYESFFGTDLSAVRVHEGGESADLNRSIAARAFTTGSDVFLGSDASTGDRELMAHELTHVVQQTG